MIRRLLIVLLLLGLPSLAQATNYYISPTGNNGAPNDGSSTSQPWLTFAYAFANMAGSPVGCGHTLNLADGVYGDGTSTGKLSLAGRACTLGQELTIRAVNSRQARIHDDGTGRAGFITSSGATRSSYIILDGLTVSSADNSGSTLGLPIQINNSDHIIVRNVLAYNPNRYANTHLVTMSSVTDVLVEDFEGYTFHRHCINPNSSSTVVIRRAYCNPRTGKLAGTVYTPVGTGDALASLYPCTNCIVENAIMDGTSGRGYLSEMNGTGSIALSGNKIVGSICYNCRANGIYLNARGSTALHRPTNITIQDVVIHGLESGSALRNSNGVNITLNRLTLLGTATSGYVADDSNFPSTVNSFTITNSIAKGFSGTGFTSSGVETITGSTTNYANGNGTAFSPVAASWGSGNVTTDPALGTCIAWPPDGSAAAAAGVGATILYRTENGVTGTTPLWDPTTGEFPHGATVTGINDVAGNSLFDVHERLNVNTGGCDFPSSYAGGGGAANPAGQVTSQGTTSPSHVRTVTASKEALTAGISLYDAAANVGTVTGVTSSCGSEALTQVGTAVTSPAYRRVYLFRRLNPTAGGSCTISATTSGTVTASVLISNEYDNVAAFGTAVTATGLSSIPSVTASVASDAGNIIVDMLASKCGLSAGACTTTLTATGTGQTLQGNQGHLTLGDIRGATSQKSSTNGGDVAYVTNNTYWAMVAVPMCAVSCSALTHVLTQSAGQVDSAFYVNGAVSALGAVNAANVDIPVGTSFMVCLQTDSTVAAVPTAGRKLYFSRNSGAYVPMLDTVTTGISFHGSTADPNVVSGAVSANLSGVLTNVPGETIHSVSVTPSATMTVDDSLVNCWVMKLASDAVATDTYEFREYTDAGIALDAYGATADAKITVTGTTPDIQAPTGLKLVSTSNTLVSLLWAPSTYATLAGYKVYQSDTSGSYGAPIMTLTPDIAEALNITATQWSVQTLVGDTYYFVVTAFDLNGNESAVSNEVTAVQTGLTARTGSVGGVATARTASGERGLRGEQAP